MDFIGWIVISALMLTSIGVIVTWLFFFLRPNNPPPPKALPMPGERWYCIVGGYTDGSPWSKPNPRQITAYIVDVKAGWVRYHHGREDMCRNEIIEDFIRIWHREAP